MGNLRSLVALATGFAVAAASANDGRRNPLVDAEFREVVRRAMDFAKVPGVAIAVVDGDDVFSQGYGLERFDRPDKPCTDQTLFYAGSTTKSQTAACLSMMINNKSTTAIPSCRTGGRPTTETNGTTAHVTLEDLVSHRHGLPRHDRSLMQARDGVALPLREIIRDTRNLEDENEPRVKFIYSNYGYMFLSYVIEKLTGKGLVQVMHDLLWDRLGMNSTFFGLQDARERGGDRLAAGHIWLNETQQYKQVTYMPLTDLSGAGAVISNVGDYAKWIRALLNQTELFSTEVYEDIKKPRMVADPFPHPNIDVDLYGLGWHRTTYKGRVVYWHDGVMIGFRSQVWWFPNDDYGMVVFTNSDGSDMLPSILGWQHLIPDRFGIPVEDRFNATQSQQTKSQKYNNAVRNLYPEFYNKTRTNQTSQAQQQLSAPSSFSFDALAGRYSNEGYGTMTLRRSSANNETVLLVERPEMTWRYGLTFRHVYADNWIAAEAWVDDLTSPGVFHPVKFVGAKNSTGGKVGAMRIAWQYQGATEANVTFHRESSM
ncbi:hypothetical protein CP532_3088 [Ophiocordyceps camponoti-leonardi (nom. inval.)]|nr:hypothetical protein CP532_3088 [Ophiocordyceps camponoti-leonardi (nom. inval.)]